MVESSASSTAVTAAVESSASTESLTAATVSAGGSVESAASAGSLSIAAESEGASVESATSAESLSISAESTGVSAESGAAACGDTRMTACARRPSTPMMVISPSSRRELEPTRTVLSPSKVAPEAPSMMWTLPTPTSRPSEAKWSARSAVMNAVESRYSKLPTKRV